MSQLPPPPGYPPPPPPLPLPPGPVYYAPAPAPHSQAVRADQVESTLDDLDLLRQLSTADSAESGHPDAM